jgi:hypothetical protein
MAVNVKSRIFLKARVCVLNDTSGPKEGAQWHQMHHCVIAVSKSEWDWRYAAAIDILCGGSTDYTSYGDAIGHGWV